jgi:hypothetical protein
VGTSRSQADNQTPSFGHSHTDKQTPSVEQTTCSKRRQYLYAAACGLATRTPTQALANQRPQLQLLLPPGGRTQHRAGQPSCQLQGPSPQLQEPVLQPHRPATKKHIPLTRRHHTHPLPTPSPLRSPGTKVYSALLPPPGEETDATDRQASLHTQRDRPREQLTPASRNSPGHSTTCHAMTTTTHSGDHIHFPARFNLRATISAGG